MGKLAALLVTGVNLALDVAAGVLALVAVLAISVYGPNAELPLILFAPYAHTAILWCGVYLLSWRMLWPSKPLYFLFLWGFQEAWWNAVYFVGRLPWSLTGWGYVAPDWHWWAYVYVTVAAGAMSAWLLRRRLRVSRPWAAVLAVEVAILVLFRMPGMVLDPLAQVLTPSNWVWETLGGALTMGLYLLMFRGRLP